VRITTAAAVLHGECQRRSLGGRVSAGQMEREQRLSCRETLMVREISHGPCDELNVSGGSVVSSGCGVGGCVGCWSEEVTDLSARSSLRVRSQSSASEWFPSVG
jgi:hypothetical protein